MGVAIAVLSSFFMQYITVNRGEKSFCLQISGVSTNNE